MISTLHRVSREFSGAPRRTCRIQNHFNNRVGGAGHYFDSFAGGLLVARTSSTRLGAFRS
jgi:hypothetical protein